VQHSVIKLSSQNKCHVSRTIVYTGTNSQLQTSLLQYCILRYYILSNHDNTTGNYFLCSKHNVRSSVSAYFRLPWMWWIREHSDWMWAERKKRVSVRAQPHTQSWVRRDELWHTVVRTSGVTLLCAAPLLFEICRPYPEPARFARRILSVAWSYSYNQNCVMFTNETPATIAKKFGLKN